MINDSPVESKANPEASQVSTSKLVEYVNSAKDAVANSTSADLSKSQQTLPPIDIADHKSAVPTDANGKVSLPGLWEKGVKDVKDNVQVKVSPEKDSVQVQVAPGLLDTARNVAFDSAKVMGAGYGLYLLSQEKTRFSSLALLGTAGLSAYDDYQFLRKQTSFNGVAKYSAALIADATMAAGAAGLLVTDYNGGPAPACAMAFGMLERMAIGLNWKDKW